MKKAVIHLGDKIITTKKFPKGEGKKGIIIHKEQDAYGIKFNESFEDCHYLDGILEERKGYYLETNQFKIISSYKCNDKRKENFIHLLKDQSYYEKSLTPLKIDREKNNKEWKRNEIKTLYRSIQNYEKEMIMHEENIKKIKKEWKKDININNFEKEYDRLKKHKLIKNILVEESPTTKIKFIIVTTNNLTYRDNRNKADSNYYKNFNLGAYKIFIPMNVNNAIKIINYKRQLYKGTYFHPCIRDGGMICFGEQVKEELNAYRKNGQYTPLIFLIINFLKEPNYRDPYIHAKIFDLAQDVTIKPKDVFNYLSHTYWRTYQKWDNDSFNAQRIKIGLSPVNNPN